MSITTYAELQQAVKDWLNKPDVDQSVTTFIALAEADMQRKLRHWEMEERAAITLDAQYVALPTDWLETVRLSIGTDALELLSQSVLLDKAEYRDGVGGQPRFYVHTGGQIEIFPVPDESYTGEIVYFKRFAALADVDAPNWILDRHPEAYLYGALVHSAPFLGDDARTATWASLYQSTLDEINRMSRRAQHSGTGLKVRIRSY